MTASAAWRVFESRKYPAPARKESVNEPGIKGRRDLPSNLGLAVADPEGGIPMELAAYLVLTVGVFALLGIVQRLVERL